MCQKYFWSPPKFQTKTKVLIKAVTNAQLQNCHPNLRFSFFYLWEILQPTNKSLAIEKENAQKGVGREN